MFCFWSIWRTYHLYIYCRYQLKDQIWQWFKFWFCLCSHKRHILSSREKFKTIIITYIDVLILCNMTVRNSDFSYWKIQCLSLNLQLAYYELKYFKLTKYICKLKVLRHDSSSIFEKKILFFNFLNGQYGCWECFGCLKCFVKIIKSNIR